MAESHDAELVPGTSATRSSGVERHAGEDAGTRRELARAWLTRRRCPITAPERPGHGLGSTSGSRSCCSGSSVW